MALLDNDKDILPVSSIAELLSAKARTLKMYEEKGLFPHKEGSIKKLYSINDVNMIAFVHYLASVRKINANGIKYILEMLHSMDEESKKRYLEMIENKLEKISAKEIVEVDAL